MKTAHRHGIYVVLDIILNHSGNVFGYDADRYWPQDPVTGREYFDPRWDGHPYRIAGFHDQTGQPSLPFGLVNLEQHPGAWPGGALWPEEFQHPENFTRKGRIHNWDNDPEYLEGDFFDLKDINLGEGDIDHYAPSVAF